MSKPRLQITDAAAEGILAWFARNSVAANLLMALIVVGGLVSLRAILIQAAPDITYHVVSVSVPFPGGGPEEVEEAICARIEERLQGLERIQHIRSVAAEGIGYLTIELIAGADVRRAVDEIKTRIDSIDSFPEGVDEPIVQQLDPLLSGISVAISGPADERTLAHLGQKVRDEIQALPGVTQVVLTGVRPYEVSIEVSDRALRRQGVTFVQVADAVRGSSLDLPAGAVKSRDGEILLRTHGQVYRGTEFEDLVLLSLADGTRLTVGDVAEVRDGFAETATAMRLDGNPAVLVSIYRVGGQDSTEIAERVKAYLDVARPLLPEGIWLSLWTDDSESLAGRVGTMLKNGRAGFLLVLVLLALFLRPRLAVWVALGIPISFLGTLWCLPALDVPIDMVSTLGFVIVLGIVVDDALVVGENICRHHEQGKEGLTAAIQGVREVAQPVFFSSITTIVAFIPMLAVPGIIGEIMRTIPIVVILTLSFSLVESLFVLPSHLSHLRAREDSNKLWNRFQRTVAAQLDGFVRRIYLPALKWALRWRFTTIAIACTLLILTVGLVAGGRLKFAFFPPVEADRLVVSLTLPQGTSSESTGLALEHIEKQVEELRRQFIEEDGSDPVRHVLETVGSQPSGGVQFATAGELAQSGSHLGEVALRLVPPDQRRVSAEEIGRRLRSLVGQIPDAVALNYNFALIEAGKPIDIEITGSEFADLSRAAAALKQALANYPGIYDVADTLHPGKREIRLSITAEAEALGLTLSDLAGQVRHAFYGEEAQRVQRGQTELKAMVRYPEEDRRRLASLEDMRIRTPQGHEIPFAVAGRIDFGRSLARIERTDGKRTVNVTAAVDLTRGNPNEILQDLRQRTLPELMRTYPGLTCSFAGEQQEQQQAMGGLARNTLLALFLVYALLAVSFGSYFQPLIVLSAVPFGIVGAIWGHLVMGNPMLTFYSVLGIVALGGVVVNDSLVLVDFINRSRSPGLSLEESAIRAGSTRLRPIFLTSATTFVGLIPLLTETSVQAQFLVPMATSLAFGVLFATLISLILVPVAYCILEDARRLLGGRPQAPAKRSDK